MYTDMLSGLELLGEKWIQTEAVLVGRRGPERGLSQ